MEIRQAQNIIDLLTDIQKANPAFKMAELAEAVVPVTENSLVKAKTLKGRMIKWFRGYETKHSHLKKVEKIAWEALQKIPSETETTTKWIESLRAKYQAEGRKKTEHIHQIELKELADLEAEKAYQLMKQKSLLNPLRGKPVPVHNVDTLREVLGSTKRTEKYNLHLKEHLVKNHRVVVAPDNYEVELERRFQLLDEAAKRDKKYESQMLPAGKRLDVKQRNAVRNAQSEELTNQTKQLATYDSFLVTGSYGRKIKSLKTLFEALKNLPDTVKLLFPENVRNAINEGLDGGTDGVIRTQVKKNLEEFISKLPSSEARFFKILFNDERRDLPKEVKELMPQLLSDPIQKQLAQGLFGTMLDVAGTLPSAEVKEVLRFIIQVIVDRNSNHPGLIMFLVSLTSLIPSHELLPILRWVNENLKQDLVPNLLSPDPIKRAQAAEQLEAVIVETTSKKAEEYIDPFLKEVDSLMEGIRNIVPGFIQRVTLLDRIFASGPFWVKVTKQPNGKYTVKVYADSFAAALHPVRGDKIVWPITIVDVEENALNQDFYDTLLYHRYEPLCNSEFQSLPEGLYKAINSIGGKWNYEERVSLNSVGRNDLELMQAIIIEREDSAQVQFNLQVDALVILCQSVMKDGSLCFDETNEQLKKDIKNAADSLRTTIDNNPEIAGERKEAILAMVQEIQYVEFASQDNFKQDPALLARPVAEVLRLCGIKKENFHNYGDVLKVILGEDLMEFVDLALDSVDTIPKTTSIKLPPSPFKTDDLQNISHIRAFVRNFYFQMIFQTVKYTYTVCRGVSSPFYLAYLLFPEVMKFLPEKIKYYTETVVYGVTTMLTRMFTYALVRLLFDSKVASIIGKKRDQAGKYLKNQVTSPELSLHVEPVTSASNPQVTVTDRLIRFPKLPDPTLNTTRSFCERGEAAAFTPQSITGDFIAWKDQLSLKRMHSADVHLKRARALGAPSANMSELEIEAGAYLFCLASFADTSAEFEALFYPWAHYIEQELAKPAFRFRLAREILALFDLPTEYILEKDVSINDDMQIVIEKGTVIDLLGRTVTNNQIKLAEIENVLIRIRELPIPGEDDGFWGQVPDINACLIALAELGTALTFQDLLENRYALKTALVQFHLLAIMETLARSDPRNHLDGFYVNASSLEAWSQQHACVITDPDDVEYMDQLKECFSHCDSGITKDGLFHYSYHNGLLDSKRASPAEALYLLRLYERDPTLEQKISEILRLDQIRKDRYVKQVIDFAKSNPLFNGDLASLKQSMLSFIIRHLKIPSTVSRFVNKGDTTVLWKDCEKGPDHVVDVLYTMSQHLDKDFVVPMAYRLLRHQTFLCNEFLIHPEEDSARPDSATSVPSSNAPKKPSKKAAKKATSFEWEAVKPSRLMIFDLSKVWKKAVNLWYKREEPPAKKFVARTKFDHVVHLRPYGNNFAAYSEQGYSLTAYNVHNITETINLGMYQGFHHDYTPLQVTHKLALIQATESQVMSGSLNVDSKDTYEESFGADRKSLGWLIFAENMDQIPRIVSYFLNESNALSSCNWKAFKFIESVLFRGSYLKNQLLETPVFALSLGELVSKFLTVKLEKDHQRANFVELGVNIFRFCKYYAPEYCATFPDLKKAVKDHIDFYQQHYLLALLSDAVLREGEEPSEEALEAFCIGRFYGLSTPAFRETFQRWLPAIHEALKRIDFAKRLAKSFLEFNNNFFKPSDLDAIILESGIIQLPEFEFLIDVRYGRVACRNYENAKQIPQFAHLQASELADYNVVAKGPESEIEYIYEGKIYYAVNPATFSTNRFKEALDFIGVQLTPTTLIWIEKNPGPRTLLVGDSRSFPKKWTRYKLITSAENLSRAGVDSSDGDFASAVFSSINKVSGASVKASARSVGASSGSSSSAAPITQYFLDISGMDELLIPNRSKKGIQPLKRFCNPEHVICHRRVKGTLLESINIQAYNLKFTVKDDNGVPRAYASETYPDFYIVPQQDMRSLRPYGCYLLLKNARGEHKVLLPSGHVLTTGLWHFYKYLQPFTHLLPPRTGFESDNGAYFTYSLDAQGHLTSEDPASLINLVQVHLVQQNDDLLQSALNQFLNLAAHQPLPADVWDQLLPMTGIVPYLQQAQKVRMRLFAAMEANRLLQPDTAYDKGIVDPKAALIPLMFLQALLVDLNTLANLNELEKGLQGNGALSSDKEWYLYKGVFRQVRRLLNFERFIPDKVRELLINEQRIEAFIEVYVLPEKLFRRYQTLKKENKITNSFLQQVLNGSKIAVTSLRPYDGINLDPVSLVQNYLTESFPDFFQQVNDVLDAAHSKMSATDQLVSIAQKVQRPSNLTDEGVLRLRRIDNFVDVNPATIFDARTMTPELFFKRFTFYYMVARGECAYSKDRTDLQAMLTRLNMRFDADTNYLIELLEHVISCSLIYPTSRELKRALESPCVLPHKTEEEYFAIQVTLARFRVDIARQIESPGFDESLPMTDENLVRGFFKFYEKAQTQSAVFLDKHKAALVALKASDDKGVSLFAAFLLSVAGAPSDYLTPQEFGKLTKETEALINPGKLTPRLKHEIKQLREILERHDEFYPMQLEVKATDTSNKEVKATDTSIKLDRRSILVSFFSFYTLAYEKKGYFSHAYNLILNELVIDSDPVVKQLATYLKNVVADQLNNSYASPEAFKNECLLKKFLLNQRYPELMSCWTSIQKKFFRTELATAGTMASMSTFKNFVCTVARYGTGPYIMWNARQTISTVPLILRMTFLFSWTMNVRKTIEERNVARAAAARALDKVGTPYADLQVEDHMIDDHLDRLFEMAFSMSKIDNRNEKAFAQLDASKATEATQRDRFTRANNGIVDFYGRDQLRVRYELRNQQAIWRIYQRLSVKVSHMEQALKEDESKLVDLVNTRQRRNNGTPITFLNLVQFQLTGDLRLVGDNLGFNADALQKLEFLIVRHLIKGSRLQQLKRVQGHIEGLSRLDANTERAKYYETMEAIADELTARRVYKLDSINSPRLLLRLLCFEYFSNRLIWPKQLERVKELLLEKKGNQVLELIMGLGKTVFGIPVITDVVADRNTLAVIIWPAGMAETNIRQIGKQNRAFFQKNTNVLRFDREHPMTPNHLQAIKVMLNGCLENCETLNMTREQLQALQLSLIEVLYDDYNGIVHAGRDVDQVLTDLRDILLLIRTKARLIGDEAHELFNHSQELNYPVGAPKPIKGKYYQIMERCVKFLMEDDTIRRTITGNNKIEITQVLKVKIANRFRQELDLKHFTDEPEFVNFVTGASKSVPESLKKHEAFAEISLIKGMLNVLIPNALSKVSLVDYGPSNKGNGEYARPYEGNTRPMENSLLRNPYEALAKTFVQFLHSGLADPVDEDAPVGTKKTYTRVEKTLKKLVELAEKKAKQSNSRIENTQQYVDFKKFCPDANVYDPKSWTQYFESLASSTEFICFYVENHVYDQITYWQENICSNSQNFGSIAAEQYHVTGTPYNDGTYPSVLKTLDANGTPTIMNDKGTIGDALHIASNKCPADGIKILEQTKPRAILEEVLTKYFTKGSNFTALIDGSAVLAGMTERDVVKAMFKHIKERRDDIQGERRDDIQGVVFFDGSELVCWKVGALSPDPLDSSSVPPEARLTYYDHLHGFAADVPQKPNGKAVNLVGDRVTLYRLLQEIFRMRGIKHWKKLVKALDDKLLDLVGQTQEVHFAMTKESAKVIRPDGDPNVPPSFRDIVQYAVMNEAKVGDDNYFAFRNQITDAARSYVMDALLGAEKSRDMRLIFRKHRDILITRIQDDPAQLWGWVDKLEKSDIVLADLMKKQIELFDGQDRDEVKALIEGLKPPVMPDKVRICTDGINMRCDAGDVDRVVTVTTTQTQNQQQQLQQEQLQQVILPSNARIPFVKEIAWERDLSPYDDAWKVFLNGETYYKKNPRVFRLKDVVEKSQLSEIAPSIDPRIWISNHFLPGGASRLGTAEQRPLLHLLVHANVFSEDDDDQTLVITSVGCISVNDAGYWRYRLSAVEAPKGKTAFVYDVSLGKITWGGQGIDMSLSMNADFAKIEAQLKFLNGDTMQYTPVQGRALRNWIQICGPEKVYNAALFINHNRAKDKPLKGTLLDLAMQDCVKNVRN